MPVRGLNSPKTDGRNRCIPCHADVEEDLVGRVATPAADLTFGLRWPHDEVSVHENPEF